MVDSADRPNPTSTSPYDFQITRQQSIFNGFFSRVATTEVVLEWCQDNVPQSTLGVDISGSAHSLTIVGGNYTVAELLNTIVVALEDVGIAGYDFSVETGNGTVSIYSGADDREFEFTSDPQGILDQLGMALNVLAPNQVVGCPDLRPYRYIDFVCNQLTYPQSVKDATTALITRDVLCRWYFAEDTPDLLDQYGFPVLMGYTRFCRRRLFNPPKYIKWDNNLPVGNLTFQVYGNDGSLLSIAGSDPERNNWLMTLQLSEN
jgi:hypothetical protein